MGATEWKPLYEVGDQVRVIDGIWGHGFEIGEVVEVVEVDHKDESYRCDGKKYYWWLTEEEVELISKN